ncbi:MAG: PKD domain-containing protein, partial [Thermoplasmata archaeon]|nr:PKD domain-containing protein [Thermoplasmata archaeon]
MFSDANGTVYLDDILLVEIVPNNSYLDGAIAETIVSTSARSFSYPTNYGQSLIADMIRSGVTGVKGYCYEPYLDAIAHPDILFERYTSGYNLAESYYAASIKLSWMDVVVGDPKLAPYALLPDLVIQEPVIMLDQKNSFNHSFEFTVTNIGGSQSGDWNLTITISNATQSWDYALEGEPLFAGEYMALFFNWSAPEADTYTIELILNHSGFEQRKDNNHRTDTLNVFSPPDLVPKAFSLSPEIPSENTSFQLTITLFNSGESMAEDVNLSLYSEGECLASIVLNAGGLENAFGTFNLTLPAGLYALCVIADPEKKIMESNESNNEYEFRFRVNALPKAILGENITTRVGIEVGFNASASYDLDGNITYYSWDIDGIKKVGISVTHTFANRGNFTVTLLVRDNDGTEHKANILVFIENTPPVPVFHLPENILTLENLIFDARMSYDNDTTPLAYLWDFGDGSNSSKAMVRHAYTKPGNYMVTLQLTDDVNASTSLSRVLIVKNRPPEVVIVVEYQGHHYPSQAISEVRFLSLTPIILNLTGSFDPDGNLASIRVDYGDGHYYSGPFMADLNHTYSHFGYYNLSLRLVDDLQGSSWLNLTISVVNTAPRSLFTYTPPEPGSYDNVVFTSLSTDNGEIVEYVWDIDGTIYIGETLTYSFSTYGYHYVSLTVRDNEGLEATYFDGIFVNDIPAEIKAQDVKSKEGEKVRITWVATDRDGGISHYLITFPDGTIKETRKQFLDHTFEEPGTYELNITVVDDYGLTNSTTLTVHVSEKE